MAGGEEHARHGEDFSRASGDQPVEPLADHRPREFEIAMVERPVRKARFKLFGKRGELGDRLFVAAAVAAEHHPGWCAHAWTPVNEFLSRTGKPPNGFERLARGFAPRGS